MITMTMNGSQSDKDELVPFPYCHIMAPTDLVSSSSSADASDLALDDFPPSTSLADSKTSEDSFPWTNTSSLTSPSISQADIPINSEDVRKPSLIRRLSQGAQAKLRRRSSARKYRPIAGPVVLRRPSDLASVADVDVQFLADLELEPCSEVDDDIEYMSSSIISVESNNALGLTPTPTALPAFESIAPTISSILEQGTWVQKVTKKSRKSVKLSLDSSAAKVCWQTSKKDTTKPKSSKQFYIDDIMEIRLGVDARNSRQDIQITTAEEARWMTIIYDSSSRSSRDIKMMHFIAPNQYILKLWIEALKSVERERIEIMNALSADHDKSARSMQLAWTHIMAQREADHDCRLTVEDAKDICRTLEINCATRTIETHFGLTDFDRRGSLDYSQYERFIGLFKIRHDIKAIYDRTKTGDYMILLDFLAFVEDVQLGFDTAYWEKKFHSITFKHNSPGAPPGSMTLAAFQKFLTSNSNACRAPADASSLDHPLNDYFISSSHNTYLMGRQVAGDSTVEGYINALARGCRCVEVDCWDGKDGRPMVNHGRTLSTEVLFEDCIHVINKYAFTSSPYPLIISLEVHCGPEQQAAMHEIMMRIFGTALILAPINDTCVLPSPEELRGRILIKVKSHQPFDIRSPSVSTPISPAMTTPNSPIISATATSDFEIDSEPLMPAAKVKTSNITPLLASLGVYVRGMKYSDFASPGANMYNHVFSLAETAYATLCKEDLWALEQHNSRFFMRVYPARMRLDSSNFDPLQSWLHGVQMVALNWQTNDVNMQVNHAMFDSGSDRSGYVLKPLDMRCPSRGIKFVKFSVDIISAQRLPRPRSAPDAMNPYIQMEIITADQARGVIVEGGETTSGLCRRTRSVEGNGFNPQFDANMTVSIETKYPELVFVRWTVWTTDKADTMIATFTAKLDSLRQGYRHLPLYNTYGERYREAKLFVKLAKDEPIVINADDGPDFTSPRLESKSWSRRMLSRTPGARKLDKGSRGSTRQSSPEGLRSRMTG